MGIGNAKNGKLLYHLTELKNLESIVLLGLVPRKVLLENEVKFEDVANPEIIIKRQELGLSEYIPFHFHPYTAFDVAVKNQRKPRGQAPLTKCEQGVRTIFGPNVERC